MAESADSSGRPPANPGDSTSAKPPDLPPPADEPNNLTIQETQNMETHAHHLHHAPGIKIWHYFYEFLMLFLAVFCGFLAENQREHMVESRREKEYMRSMLADLKEDTAEIDTEIHLIETLLNPVLKKSTALLYAENFSDSIIREMYDTVPKSTRFFAISFQDNAATQLKSSGNLRLVRNKEITDSLSRYWSVCDYLINVQLASYETTRLKSKELIFSLFNLNYFENNSVAEPLRKNISLKLMSNDRVQFITLGNHLSNMHTQITGAIFQRLKTIHQKATDLIALIQKEYHLE